LTELLAARQVEVFHQCREDSVERVTCSYKAAGVSARVVSFIDDMAGAYEWADIIISRAGASSVAEISCVNRPAIFVPYPFQQGTHQTDNAMTLVGSGKALLIEETEPDFNGRLRGALDGLLEPEAFHKMKQTPFEPMGLEAAKTIAMGVSSLARKRA
jgi:UDP-N-acetylglucosamine--N-acetylmuramyl-(pentapeptide) pyrophosphoryl-undecaprenol N-acetylglucosamine transferase